MDRLGAFRLFPRAVEAGTITGAGRRLGLSSTAASCALQEPEAELGPRLLDRTTRRLSPTEAGRLVACLPGHRAHPAGYQAAIYAVHARGPAVPAKVTAFVAHLRAALAPVEAD